MPGSISPSYSLAFERGNSMSTEPYTRTLNLDHDDIVEILVRYFNVPHGNIRYDSTIGRWKVKIYQYKYERILAWNEIKEAQSSILE